MGGLQSKLEKLSESQAKLRIETPMEVSEAKEERRELYAAVDRRKRQTMEKSFKDLQKTLIELYKEEPFSEIQVSPPDDIKVHIDKIYTKLVIVEEVLDLRKQGEKKKIEIELYSNREVFFNGKKRRKYVVIVGSAGKGKTTYCCQLAQIWSKIHGGQELAEREQTSKAVACGQEETLCQFEYLFLIQLRLVNGPTSIYNAICSTLLKEYGYLHRTVKEVLSKHPDKVLVICDGLDKYHATSPPSREYLHGCTVLTTTRPWKYESIRTGSDTPDIVLQLKGLEDEGVKQLTERMMVHFNKNEGKTRARQCICDIRNAKLEKAVQIPLILTYLVHLWYFTKDKLSQGITVNLTKLVLCILQKGEEKIKDDLCLKEIPPEWMKTLPGVLHNEPELEPYGDLLLCVAKLAFKGLISKNREESLIFRGRTLDKYFNDPLQKEACFKLGLLSECKISHEGRISIAVSFYHKLIQEFFSAIHAVCSEEYYRELCNFCKTTEDILDIANVYRFISGLCPEIGAKFSKHVAEVISADSRVAKWREEGDAFSVVMEQLTDLNGNCLLEMEHSTGRTDHVFYITDICVVDNTPTYMECLLRNASQTLVTMDMCSVTLTKTEWMLLLHVVCESPSLQILKLWGISIGDENVGEKVLVFDANANASSHSALQRVELRAVSAPLLPLLNRARRTTVTQQDNSGSDGDFTDGLTSVTAGTLTCLELRELSMTRFEWDMLVTIVNESTSLQELKLEDISIDTGDSVPVYDVNPNTSSHSVLQQVAVWRVRVSLLALLRRVRRTTVTQQGVGGGDGDCIGGPTTAVTTGTLTHLDLEDVEMTKCEWDMLVNIVRESPSLQTLELGPITIGGEQRNIDCWRQMYNAIRSSQSVTKTELDVHETIGNMQEWRTFTPDRWRRRSRRSRYFNFMEMELNKI